MGSNPLDTRSAIGGSLPAIALLLLIGAFLLAGCRSDIDEDTLVYGSTLEPNTLNPLLAPDIASRQAIELLFDGLVVVDDRFEVQPRLATDWYADDEGKVWTFHLRQDVKWHDGREFDSQDVAFTYERLLDPHSGATLARGDYAVIERVEALDRWTVRFHLARPATPLLSRLTVGIVPRHLLADQNLTGADFNRQPVGTGPYTLEEWQSGQKLVFRANPAYFDGEPEMSNLVWQVVPDSATLTMQVVGGDVHIALIADPRDRTRLLDDPTIGLAQTLSGNLQISFQLGNPLFQDTRVRRALAHAIDRSAIVDGILQGEAVLATSDILPTSWAYNPDVRTYQFDPDQARRLLAETGWHPGADGILRRDGQPLSFELATYAGERLYEQVMLLVQQDWNDIGLDVRVNMQERNTFVTQRILKADFEAALLHSAVQADPDISRRFHSASIGQGQNFLGYSNPEVDALLQQGAAAIERERRQVIYAEVQQLMAEDLPQISLVHPIATYAFPSHLTNVRPTPLGPFWNVAEWRYGAD